MRGRADPASSDFTVRRWTRPHKFLNQQNQERPERLDCTLFYKSTRRRNRRCASRHRVGEPNANKALPHDAPQPPPGVSSYPEKRNCPIGPHAQNAVCAAGLSLLDHNPCCCSCKRWCAPPDRRRLGRRRDPLPLPPPHPGSRRRNSSRRRRWALSAAARAPALARMCRWRRWWARAAATCCCATPSSSRTTSRVRLWRCWRLLLLWCAGCMRWDAADLTACGGKCAGSSTVAEASLWMLHPATHPRAQAARTPSCGR